MRLRWLSDGSWVDNADDMYFRAQCDYKDTYTTNNSKVSCSTALKGGETTCTTGSGFASSKTLT